MLALLAHLALGDLLVEDGRGVRLALLGVLGGDVLEHDLDAGACGLVGDAGAHHPGTQHSELGGAELLEALGTQRAGVDRLQVEEERLDHVLGVLPDDELGQVARLDACRGLQVDLRTLDRGGQDGARCRVVGALGLLAQVRRERRQERRELGVARRAARHLVARPVPRLYGGLLVVAVLQHPCLGGRDEVVDALDELVDQTPLLRRLRLEPGAGEQHVHQAVVEPEHPDDARDTAPAGEQAEADLGQAELGARVVVRDPVVAGQRDLQTATERGAVDRRADRLAERLQPPKVRLDAFDVREDLGGVVGAGLDHALEVAAGEERLLRTGDDHADDVVLLGLEPVDRRGHGLLVELVHGVGPGRGVVEGQRDDAVLVAVVADGCLSGGRACRGHWCSLRDR